MASFICACCFAAGESEKCAACEKLPCPDCKADTVLMKLEQEEEAPPLDTEDYDGFIHRLEEQILPAYKEHFENDVRRRWRTRCEVARAVIFSQAMHNYLRKELSEEGVSEADVRYAVALRSFGKLKKEPRGPKVLHLD